jgi:flagellar motor component MotA
MSLVIAFFMLNYPVTYLPVRQAISFASLTTVVSILVGIVFLKESFGLIQMLGSVMIIIGVYNVNRNQTCIDACNKCAQACYECFQACLNEPDVKARKNCISMLVECAMSCQMSTSLMSMQAQSSMEHCKLCATICNKCAKECEMFKEEHCQQCAAECENMASM